MARIRRAGRSGLTLIELMVVLAMLVILSGMAAPSFRNLLASSRLQAAAREILAQGQFARDLAVRHDTYTQLTIDVETRLHGVQELVTDPDNGQQDWQLSGAGLARPRSLPEGIDYDKVVASEEGGERTVTFGPDGRAEDWFVSVKDQRGNRLAVRVVGVTGAVDVLSPDDGDVFEQLEQQAADL